MHWGREGECRQIRCRQFSVVREQWLLSVRARDSGRAILSSPAEPLIRPVSHCSLTTDHNQLTRSLTTSECLTRCAVERASSHVSPGLAVLLLQLGGLRGDVGTTPASPRSLRQRACALQASPRWKSHLGGGKLAWAVEKSPAAVENPYRQCKTCPAAVENSSRPHLRRARAPAGPVRASTTSTTGSAPTPRGAVFAPGSAAILPAVVIPRERSDRGIPPEGFLAEFIPSGSEGLGMTERFLAALGMTADRSFSTSC